MVVGIYVLFGLIALAIDRRALLVSALAYVLCAMTQLFRTFGAVEVNVALTAFVIGSALLLLSAFWQNARAVVVGVLPDDLANQLRATVRPAGTAATGETSDGVQGVAAARPDRHTVVAGQRG